MSKQSDDRSMRERLYEADLIVERVIPLLTLGANDAGRAPDWFDDFIEDHGEEVAALFDWPVDQVMDRRGREEVLGAMSNEGGWIITGVGPKFDVWEDRRGARVSWGWLSGTIVYGQTYEEALGLILDWAEARQPDLIPFRATAGEAS